MARLGIDLGTSNSAAALLREEGQEVKMVEPSEGVSYYASVFPSYVAFDYQGNVMAVGLWAKERFRQGEFVIRHFKRLMGRTYDYVAQKIAGGNRAFLEFKEIIERGPSGEVLFKVGPKKYNVEEIAAFLLKKIKEEAETTAGKLWNESIDEVTISVPAAWDNDQRQATHEAARLAGFIGIKVIEEPRAAAVYYGLQNEEKGNFVVIDIGAGTSDIVVGHMTKIDVKTQLLITTRTCDDVLGGMDMDNLLLEYVVENDQTEPRLADIYPRLDKEERNRLMAAIEEAKINTCMEGASTIAISLPIDGGRPKRLSVPLEEKTVNNILNPLIHGYEENKRRKGIKPLIENTLLEVAGSEGKVEEVKQQLQKLILVGGPSRMRLMHEMLKNLFHSNKKINEDLDAIDPWNTFFMESVACGAAMSNLTNSGTVTPYPISCFHWENGLTRIIPKGVPYDPEIGITRSAKISVHPDLNIIYVLSEKDREQTLPKEWTMRSHLVRVPTAGELEITLHWSEAGTERSKSSIKGAGLPGKIDFPEAKDAITVGAAMEESFKIFLRDAKDLRQRIEACRELCKPWLENLLQKELDGMGKKNPFINIIQKKQLETMIEQKSQEMLSVSEEDLKNCEAIDPETASSLSEEDIDYALQKGFFEAREKKWAPERGISQRALKVLELTFELLDKLPSLPPEVLTDFSMMLLENYRDHKGKSDFYLQLEKCFEKFQGNPNSSNCVMLAMALKAFAIYLQRTGIIDENLYKIVVFIAHTVDRE